MTIRLIVAIITLFSLKSWGAESREFYNGVRGLGMGGTGIATANDETALLINPAGLGKLRDYYITVVDPEIELGQDTEKVAGTDVLKMSDPQDALNKALETPDKLMHTRGQIFPSIVVPNFGVGVFAKQTIDSEFDSVNNVFKYDYTQDVAAVFGFNFRFWNGIIKVGASTRIVNRTEIHEDAIDPTRTDLTKGEFQREGMGVGSDAGLILTAPIALLPSLAAVYRDMGRTSYTFNDGMFNNTATKPDQTPETIDAALSISPILGRRVRSTWTAEYRNVMNKEKDKDPMRRWHAGVELNFADAFFLRGGMNQRYWTAGMELSMFNYQFQAASYGEEIGAYPTTREDRRYVVKFAFRF